MKVLEQRTPYVRNDGREVFRVTIECEVKTCKAPVLCGQPVNPCDCGADYGMGGRRLASRSQWGEETGEHPLDIANSDGL